jgi:hypothetical protein
MRAVISSIKNLPNTLSPIKCRDVALKPTIFPVMLKNDFSLFLSSMHSIDIINVLLEFIINDRENIFMGLKHRLANSALKYIRKIVIWTEKKERLQSRNFFFSFRNSLF